MYVDILNGLIFDAVYVSWILSLLLFTLVTTYIIHWNIIYHGNKFGIILFVGG